MLFFLFFFIQLNNYNQDQSNIGLPLNIQHNLAPDNIPLTQIGAFGLWRAKRPKVPGHYHTGIDISRPSDNYEDELIFPVSQGKVISKRSDGPYAQLIIEHKYHNKKYWTLYEHIAGIIVYTGDRVYPDMAIARFMNREELNQYGWQFDHFHFEMLRKEPLKIEPDIETPERFYNSYTLLCFRKEDLKTYFYNPLQILKTGKIN